jgi:DNA-binding NarL/FixJ family response regulator
MKPSPDQASRDARPQPINGHRLSARERQIVHLAGEGHGDKEISNRLGLHTATVNTYWRRIFSKLEVHNRVAAVARVRSPGDVT